MLGVAREADQKAIKDAFRQLALKYHPDRNKKPDAEDRFKEIAEAYAVLNDPQKRQPMMPGAMPVSPATHRRICSGTSTCKIFSVPICLATMVLVLAAICSTGCSAAARDRRGVRTSRWWPRCRWSGCSAVAPSRYASPGWRNAPAARALARKPAHSPKPATNAREAARNYAGRAGEAWSSSRSALAPLAAAAASSSTIPARTAQAAARPSGRSR